MNGATSQTLSLVWKKEKLESNVGHFGCCRNAAINRLQVRHCVNVVEMNGRLISHLASLIAVGECDGCSHV